MPARSIPVAAHRTHTRAFLGATLSSLTLLTAACDRPTPTDMDAPQASVISASEKIVIVGFARTPGLADIALIQRLGGRIRHQYTYIPAMSVVIPSAQQGALLAAPGVRYVDENITMVPLGGKQIVDWGVSRIEAPAAWALGSRGQGIKVGIFDSGIDIDHPDLSVAGGIDLVADGRGLDDCNGHGTHVAGIVGARNNGKHTVGVAPAVQLYSMRFADCDWAGGTLEKMIIAVEWAITNGMHVVNMSFGFGIAGLVPTPFDPDFETGAAAAVFAEAYRRGVVLVAASGNSSTPYVGYPAAYESVIAVGATNDTDLIAEFSQWGTAQEVTAPGVNNLASYMVGQGQETSLHVRTDNDRELEAIALAFAGMTSTKGITAEAIYAGVGSVLDYAGVDCTGRIAVVMRGGPSFAEKTVAAMDAGCAAIVIHNVAPGNFNGTLGTETAPDGRPWIPAVSTSLEEGLYLKEQIEAGLTKLTLVNAFGNLAILSGTSMASPHAAGVAALIRSANPALTAQQVRAVLSASVDDLGTPGWDPIFGHGRVNAKRAVQLAR